MDDIKFILNYNGTISNVKSSDELYTIYNDYLISDDGIGEISDEDYEVCCIMRDYHNIIFVNMPKGEYDMNDFEYKSIKMLETIGAI